MTNSPTDIPILDDDAVGEIEERLSRCVELDSLADVRALCQTVRALRAENGRLKSPRLFPIQNGNPVRWELAEKAYATYRQLFGSSQSLRRLAERGGFGVGEFACLYLGHSPMCKHGKQCAAEVESQIGYVAQLQSQLEQVTKERNDLLNRSHQTVLFECGCMFKQEGLDAEPQLITHCAGEQNT